ncbi:TadC protein [Pseudoclavibacter chungangensis]|uniref:TadC protein n=1 Tax=Pseudoclavibacter chungangensis TaxID=587635 RepID=A0A7J5C092_9MICO|nr:type II secretion system F family protein [Pseudoclavibacter chungangensis]KAB1660300.1 TadC protein [Pseudoclavibacter chungangensis]NYJ65650.1 Flp pilus assembly protein TadB [Pseudoclavibacter chungangensis]
MLAFVPGAFVGIGVTLILVGLIPVRPDLRVALANIGTSTVPEASAPTSRPQRAGAWLRTHMPEWAIRGDLDRDLSLVGMNASRFYWDKLLLALVGFVGCSTLGFVMQTLGYVPAYLFSLVGVGFALLLWFVPDQELRRKARESRLEFARAVAVYLELVAAERRRGSSATHALESASRVGNTWVFMRIREELTRARLAGTRPWDALNMLSDQIRVPELSEIAKITRLSGEEGASVYETLRGRGRALRVQLLNDEHAKANQASERMSVPLTFLAFVFVGIILTPLVLNLTGGS